MKVVVAIDNSPYSNVVLDAITRRHWPYATQFKVITVLEPIPASCECECELNTTRLALEKQRYEKAQKFCQSARHKIEQAFPDSPVHFDVEVGNPKDKIVEAAVAWDADRVLVGARGRGVCPRSMTGSVSRGVASHAHCTVEIVTDKAANAVSLSA